MNDSGAAVAPTPNRAPDAHGSQLENIARGTLAGLRMYVGVIFLMAVIPKLNGDFTPRMIGFLSNVVLKQAHPFYQPFIANVVLPHAQLFAGLDMTAELLIAVALIFGIATRLFALVAFGLTVNYMLAKGAWFWVPSSNDGAFAALALALIVARAGRTFGVDRYLSRRWPRVPLW